MAHSAKHLHESDKQPLGAKATKAFVIALVLGLIGLGGALALVMTNKDGAKNDWTHFGFAYLVSFIWVLAITLGALFIVVVTHVFRAGWIVAVRRIFEAIAVNVWVVALLVIPIGILASKPGVLYVWSQKQEVVEDTVKECKVFLEHVAATAEKTEEQLKDGPADNAMPYDAASSQYSSDKAIAQKQQVAHWWSLTAEKLEYKAWGGHEGKGGFLWYQKNFFVIRLAAYFLIWMALGYFFWKHSVAQDKTKDIKHTASREWWGPASVVLFALTSTLAAYDLVLSLDPAWFSTMFGVYFFANATLSALCIVVLMQMLFNKKGLLQTANTEHLHDMGKLMFAFTFFWGYVAYSQYMLIWYASIPEETYFFEIHGLTTVASAPQYGSAWSKMGVALLVCHLFVPFAFLLSQHVKRNRICLTIAALWLLAVVWLDFYWLIMPVYSFLHSDAPTVPVFGALEVLCFLGVAGIAAAGVIFRLKNVSLIAHGDPRLHESINLDANTFTPFHGNY